MTQVQKSSRQEWRQGWKLVLASCIGFSFFSVLTHTMSMFMEPVGREFGWGRTLLSAGVTISGFVTAILSPPFGVLIDRYGSRRLALPGIVVTACAMTLIALSSGSPGQWLMLWAFYALVSIAVKTTVWTTAVSGVFEAGRGLALGITLSGVAIAQIVGPPLAQWLIAETGWRMAYVWLSLGWGGITLLACWLFLYDAHDRKRAEADGAGATRPDFAGLSIAEAWRSPALWLIDISNFVIMLMTIGLLLHQVPIMTGAGVTRVEAAWLSSLVGIAAIAGKLVTGVLLDRFRANWVGGLTLASTALAFFFLIEGVHSPLLIVLAMLVNGYSAGTKLQIASYLTARYAGMRNYGVIYGVMTSVTALGSALGPITAGFAFDMTGSYSLFLIAGTIGCLIGGTLLMALPAYPDWDKGRAEAGQG
jgi:predicted MFS family arabinose efflux permease